MSVLLSAAMFCSPRRSAKPTGVHAPASSSHSSFASTDGFARIQNAYVSGVMTLNSYSASPALSLLKLEIQSPPESTSFFT